MCGSQQRAVERNNKTSSFRGRKHRMPTPTPAAVVALGITLYQIVLLIGASDVPHLPFAVVIDEVGVSLAISRVIGG